MTVAFINGTFDIVHAGHLKLFNYARDVADLTVVAVDTDERVKRLKGSSRPINKLKDRVELLASLRQIDVVDSFTEDHELELLIWKYKADIMIKGEDYKDKIIIGERLVQKVHFVELTNDSTTKLINSIREGIPEAFRG